MRTEAEELFNKLDESIHKTERLITNHTRPGSRAHWFGPVAVVNVFYFYFFTQT